MHFADVHENVILRLVAHHQTLHYLGKENARRIFDIIGIDDPNDEDFAQMKKLLAKIRKNNWQLREAWERLPDGEEDIQYVEVFDPVNDVVVNCTPKCLKKKLKIQQMWKSSGSGWNKAGFWLYLS